MQDLAPRLQPQRTTGTAVKLRVDSRQLPTPCVAKVTGLDARNRAMVEIPGIPGVARARLVKGIRREDLTAGNGSIVEALVVFDGGCLDRPIIIGLLQPEGEISEVKPGNPSALKAAGSVPAQENVLIEALAELVFKCGAGSLTLRKDGKIILRGTHLLSRSSGPIRIKGGHVEIN